MIDLDDAVTLLHGDNKKIAALLKVNVITVKRWKSGEIKIPEAVRLLMQYIKWGQLSPIGGKDWEGFSINMKDNLLNIPGWKYGFNAHAIQAMFFKVQLVDYLKRELKESENSLAREKEALANEKKRAEYYREQLRQAGNEFRIKTTPRIKKN